MALRLGGFDKVRKLTVLQSRLLSEAMADEQLWLARINGCEIEEKTTREANSEDIALLLGMFGKG